MTFPQSVLDLFLPRRCIVCGRHLYQFERHICSVCLYDLPRTFFWTMQYNQMSQSFNALLQTHIQKEDIIFYSPVKYVFAVALFFYTGDSNYRQITRSLKYSYNLSSGKFFSRMLGRFILGCPFLKGADLIVPVPLHRRRKWSRGYNQAQIIAAELAKILVLPCIPDFLVRCRMTRTQTRLEVEDKFRNVQNAFKVNSCHLQNLLERRYHHIILVDDVFTTGATMFACYKAIMDEIYASKIDFRDIRISLVTLGYVGN